MTHNKGQAAYSLPGVVATKKVFSASVRCQVLRPGKEKI